MSNPLHVEVEGDGPPLVMLHGFTGDTTTMWPLSRALTGIRTVYAVDLPGHGRTGLLDEDALHGFVATVDLLADLFGRLDIGRADVVGYSMGGRFALGLAVLYPDLVETLTLIGASAGIADDGERRARRRADDELADDLLADGIEPFVNRWMALPLFASQDRLGAVALAAARRQRLGNDPAGLAASLRGAGSGAQPSLWSRLHEGDHQTLLLVGAEDAKFRRTAVRLADGLLRSRIAVVPDAGHAAHIENPAATAELIVEFVTERPA